MATPGNFAREWLNGYEITPDATKIIYGHIYDINQVMAQNVGIKQVAPGKFNPTLTLEGYQRHGPGALTAWNRLAPSGIGNVNDRELIALLALGNNASPVQGDICLLYDGTLVDLKGPMPYGGTLDWQGTFKPRGKRMPLSVLVDLQSAAKTATNFSSTPYDDGAESNPTSLGGVVVLELYTPTGTAATGTLTVSGTTPADGDNFVITVGGVAYTFTFKTALTPTAGQVLIGGSATVAGQNLFAAMTGGVGAGTQYATGTVPIPVVPNVDLETALVSVSTPAGATNIITLTAVNTGTAANAYALAKTGTNLAVSGATFAGGVAGDTYTITVASSATSGGSYVTHATFSAVGAVRTAQRVEIAIGTVINEFWKVTYTLASGAGTAQTFACVIAAGRYFQS